MPLPLRHRVLFTGMLCVATGAAAEPSGPPLTPGAVASPSAAAAPATRPGEAEYLVPPQGGAFEIGVHLGDVCILSFPSRINTEVMTNTPDFRGKLWEAKAWGDDGIAIRAADSAAKRTTIAASTASGTVKVNVTMTVVAADKPALTLVRFRAVTEQEAFAAQLDAAVEARLAPLKADLDKTRRDLDAVIRDRADGIVVDRLFKRNEWFPMTIHERNDDHVIVHLRRGVVVGDDGYLVFEIENRSPAMFRLASVRVLFGAREFTGAARLNSPTATRDPKLIGVVPPGVTARGMVVVRAIDQLLGKNLSMVVAGPVGTQPVVLEEVVFR
jgi:hypothetical protein